MIIDDLSICINEVINKVNIRNYLLELEHR